MTDNRVSIDLIVRRINPVKETEVDSLVDIEGEQALLRRIMTESGQSPRRASGEGRRRLVIVVAAVSLTVAAGGLVALSVQQYSAVKNLPVAGSKVPGEGAMGMPGGRCVEEYSLATLRNRFFAFDGSVTQVLPSGDTEGDEPFSQVTFRVNEWFRGDETVGDTAEVTVTMPDSGTVSSVSGPLYLEGMRLLVSGEPRWEGDSLGDSIAWACGFTRLYDPATAGQWRDVFSG